jgi:hypothetical protein
VRAAPHLWLVMDTRYSFKRFAVLGETRRDERSLDGLDHPRLTHSELETGAHSLERDALNRYPRTRPIGRASGCKTIVRTR